MVVDGGGGPVGLEEEEGGGGGEGGREGAAVEEEDEGMAVVSVDEEDATGEVGVTGWAPCWREVPACQEETADHKRTGEGVNAPCSSGGR